jgi:hypothetical protein
MKRNAFQIFLLYSTSSLIYLNKANIKETENTYPKCNYSKNKLITEKAIYKLIKDRALILRISNILGLKKKNLRRTHESFIDIYIKYLFSNKKIYNAGTISGTAKIISDLCRDIYLLSINKPRNADQAAYNYLIQTSYKPYTKFTDMHDNWGIHLHVINAGLVPFDLNNIKDYTIIHQYDRIPNFKR